MYLVLHRIAQSPVKSCENFFSQDCTLTFYSFLTPFFPFPIFFIPSRPFSISTASLINNASQHIKNISRVLGCQREGGDEGDEGMGNSSVVGNDVI